jgi:NAD(P)-dependent dehydrogenase (short-subunit alcohol dehydrogenase family)
LKDKVAIVTGAGRGIGAATAKLFAKAGAKVVISSRSKNELEKTHREIRENGGICSVFPADISSEAEVIALFEHTKNTFGAVDILVNNAAVIEVRELVEMDFDTWQMVMAINVNGPFLCSREAFKQMITAGKGGAIVNLSSLSGVRGPEKFKGFSSYVVSKYGVLGLTEILAVEGRPHGIRVNCVSPGAVATVMLKKAAPFLQTKTMPEDVAKTIFFLADEEQSRHISGANIEIFSNE